MNRYLVSFLLAFCISSAMGAIPARGVVVIEGKVVNATENSATMLTAIDCNLGVGKSLRHTAMIDSAGNFRTFVNIPYGHNFTVYYGGEFLCQYAEPGDSIYMIIDARDIRSGARYSGAHAALNNEFGTAYANLFRSFWAELPPGTMPKDEYLREFNRVHSRNLTNIDLYADSVGMSMESRDLLKRCALFSLANSAIDHRDETPEEELAFFADSIFGLDDSGNLREMMFPYHLSAYIGRLGSVAKPDSFEQMVDAIVSRHPKSMNRDIMLGLLLEKIEDETDQPRLSRDLFFDGGIYESLYCGGAEARAELPDVGNVGETLLEWSDGTAVKSRYANLKDLLAKEYAGKIVYLDLWATWCGPCIEANKSLPEVADFFRDKDVVFVSVALKSDLEKWKKLVSGRPHNCRDYFVSSDDDAELIMSAFKMGGFPSYRIIGTDSKIIDWDPPRPKHPQIYDTLLKLTSK